jgi:hypothetical protein
MFHPHTSRSSFWKWSLGFIATLVFAEGLYVVRQYRAEGGALEERLRQVSMRVSTFNNEIFAFTCPSVVRPPVATADSAKLADSDEVMGIVAGGKSRAYLLKALMDRDKHIVNDLVGDIPITITYCDMYNCARAFSGKMRGETLNIVQGGLKMAGSDMILKVGDDHYLQSSAEPATVVNRAPPFPYKPYPLARLTWKAWKEAHPDTEVYEGVLRN